MNSHYFSLYYNRIVKLVINMIKIVYFVKSRIATIDWDKSDKFIEVTVSKRKKDQVNGTITVSLPNSDKPIVYKDGVMRPIPSVDIYELHANVTPESDPTETFMGVFPLSNVCLFNDTKERNTKQSTFREAEVRNMYDAKVYEVYSVGEIKCVLPMEHTCIIYEYEDKSKEK